ncbi:MAG: enoyl-CoA hydratase/isomerase family protein [Myxococcota bacterium]
MSIRTQRDKGVVRIQLDRPRGNILDAAMIAAIRAEIGGLTRAVGVKLIVFEGSGPEFSFGASVEEHQAHMVRQMLGDFHAMFRELEALGVPTAAAVRGRCLGGGLELAAWCGRIVASPNASFAVPEVRLGVFPPMGALALAWRVGGPRATEMIVTGGAINANEAERIGLVDELAQDPSAAVDEWYQTHLSQLSASSIRYAWRAARMPLIDRLTNDLPRLESIYLESLMQTHDAREGISAFIEKRAPHFIHR